MSGSHGKIWWSELMTRDVAAARAYYENTAGWRFDTVPMADGSYHVAFSDGRAVAGIMDITGLAAMESFPPHWFTYIAVDDVDTAAAATEAAGGRVIKPPFDVPGVGRIVILADPTGAALGLMTPTERPVA